MADLSFKWIPMGPILRARNFRHLFRYREDMPLFKRFGLKRFIGAWPTLLILIALASLILGMGLPVTASYIVLGTLSAPALYNLIAHSQLVDLLAAGNLPHVVQICRLVQGMPLGILEEFPYRSGETTLSEGDLIAVYSDGVTDRENQMAESFGVDRLKQASLRSRGDEARIALYTLLGEIQGWSAGKTPDDDMTLVVARVR